MFTLRVFPSSSRPAVPSRRGLAPLALGLCLAFAFGTLAPASVDASEPRRLTLTPSETTSFSARLEPRSGNAWRLWEPRSAMVSVAFEPVGFERIGGDESLLVVEAQVELRDLRWRGTRLQMDLLDARGRRLSRNTSPAITADRDGHAERSSVRVAARVPVRATQMQLHWILEGDGDPLVPGSSYAEMRNVYARRSPSVIVSDSSDAGFVEPGDDHRFEVAVDQPGGTLFAVLVDANGRERGRFDWPVEARDGESADRGEARYAHTVSGLDTGWYAWRWQLVDSARRELHGGDLPFVVLDTAPRRADSPFGVDTALAVGYRAGNVVARERIERLSKLLARLGLLHVRERLDLRSAAADPSNPRVAALAAVSRLQREAGLDVTATFYKIPVRFALEARTAASAGPPEDLRDLERSLAAIAAELDPWISAWELWNEPNIFYFAGRSEEYAGVAKAAALGVRRGAPDATITSGSFTPVDFEWIETAMESGLSDSYDVFNYHHYRPLDRTVETIAELNTLERLHGVDRPDWISETAERFAGGEHGDRRRAVGYVKRSALARAAGADRVYSFLLNHYQHSGEEALGLLDPDDRPLRGIAALAAMTRELGAAHPLGRDPRAGDGVEILWFDPTGDGTGDAVAILWGDERAPWPDGVWPETVVDFMGVERSRPQRFGATPVYLRGTPPADLAPLTPGAATDRADVAPAPTFSGGVVLDLRLQPETDARLGSDERKQPVAVAPGDRLPVHFDLYNFNDERVELAPRMALPDGWSLAGRPPESLTVAPGERVRLATEIVVGPVRGAAEEPKVRFEATASDRRRVTPAVARLVVDAPRLPLEVVRTVADREAYRLGRGLAWQSARSDDFRFRYRVEDAPRVGVRLDTLDARGSDGVRVRVASATSWRGRMAVFAIDEAGRRWRARTSADPSHFDPALGGLAGDEPATSMVAWRDFEAIEGGTPPLEPRDVRSLAVTFVLPPGADRGGFEIEPIDLVRFARQRR